MYALLATSFSFELGTGIDPDDLNLGEAVMVSNSCKRTSYTRKFKLNTVKWYFENGKSIHTTSRHFKLHRKLVRNWLRQKEKYGGRKGKASIMVEANAKFI